MLNSTLGDTSSTSGGFQSFRGRSTPPPTPTDPIEPPPLHFSAMDEGEKEEKEKEEEEKDRGKKKLALLFGFLDPPPSPTAKTDPLPSCFGGQEQGRRRIAFFQQLMNY